MMEEEDPNVITTIQVDGLAQFFGPQELESRTTPFQEGKDDKDQSPFNTSDRNYRPLTRSRAKKIQEQMNLFLVETNFDIFDNVILSKMVNISFTKVFTRSYCWTKGEKMVYKEAEPTHHVADSTNQHKEIVVSIP